MTDKLCKIRLRWPHPSRRNEIAPTKPLRKMTAMGSIGLHQFLAPYFDVTNETVSIEISIICLRNLGIFFYALVSLLLDIDLRELLFDRRDHRGVFRLSARAGQSIASVRGVFYRVAPGLRKYKIGFRQVFPFCVRQFRHSVHPLPFQSLYGHFLSGRRVRVCSKLHS